MAATLVVAIALAGAGFVLLWLLGNQLVAGERSNAQLRAQDLGALAAAGRLPARLSFPGEDRGTAQVMDEAGVVVAATENVAGEPPIASDRPAAGQIRSAIRSDLPVGERGRFVVVSVGIDTPTGLVTVYTASTLESADETRRAIATALAAGYPILLLIVALAARAAIGRALTPVEAIRAEVAELGERDLHRRVPESGAGDEIDRLAGTMNTMLGRLERSAERQRRFVGDASHELRSPVASLRAVLEVAAAHPDTASLQGTVTDALVDTLRLERLVADLLTLARLDNPTAPSRRTILDLVSVCVDELGRRDDARIELDLPVAAAVVGDEAHVRRVITNLVDNALRHSCSVVRISIDQLDSRQALHVDDDGEGVPVTDRGRIFERFTRLDDARASDDGGSGLGLAIVAELARVLGGAVVVSDSYLGGARFTLTMPRPT